MKKLNITRPYDYDEKHLVFPCYISPKMDGVRATDDGGILKFRSGHVIQGVEHINSIVGFSGNDGELLIPGISFAESAGRIRSYNPTPDAVFFMFDRRQNDEIYKRRYKSLHKYAFRNPNIIKVIANKIIDDQTEMWYWHNRFLAAGFEGSVLKTIDHFYSGKKSWDWMRIVPVKSMDLWVASIYEGKGKYVGMLGGIECMGRGIKVNVGTGFDDFQRADFWNHPGKILGKTVRITYKERTKDGSLRHPSFDRIRHSK